MSGIRRTAVVLAALVLQMRCLIETYAPEKPIAVFKEMSKSTVSLADVTVYVRQSADSPWETVKQANAHRFGNSDDTTYIEDMEYEKDIRVEMTSYYSEDRSWQSLAERMAKLATDDSEDYAMRNTHIGPKANFFWTTHDQGYHMFVFKVFSNNLSNREEVGLDVSFYDGRPEDPSIYSQVDSQMKSKEKRIFECINVSKEIMDLQRMDHLDEEEYNAVSSGIFNIIVFSVFLKLLVFVGSFYYINRKIHEFYVTKKIIT